MLIPHVRAAPSPVPGRFIERPNRFLARVELEDGNIVPAHVPNPGRLTGVLEEGCRVYLDGPFSAPRALPYTMVLAEARTAGDRGRLVGVVTTLVNRAFPLLLTEGRFPELSGYETAGAEVVLRGSHARGSPRSRLDFLLRRRHGGSMYVEIKSVTLVRSGHALFPDAVSGRAARHCEELSGLSRAGTGAAIVFIAQRDDVTACGAAREIDPAFADALRRARRAGVLVLACSLSNTLDGASFGRRLDVLPA